jgi:hypothetical protein
MVCGEICVKPLPPVAVLEVVESWVLLPDWSNGLEAAFVKPVVVDDDFDDVRDLRASIAADAAPKAGNMTELRQRRITRTKVLRRCSASPVPRRKAQ